MPKTDTAASDGPSCFPIEIDEEIGQFIHAHPMQLCHMQLALQPIPDGNGKVLRRRNLSQELRHFLIQMAVIKPVEYFAVQDFLELLQVNHKTGLRLDIALHRHLEG